MTQVCYLKKGYVRQYSVAKNGNELTLNIFKPGSILFFLQMFNKQSNNYYYQALTDVEVYSANFDDTLGFLMSHPEITLDILKRIGRGLDGFMAQVESMTFCGCKEKLATMLLILAKRFGKKDQDVVVIELPLTHYDLACMIGVSRETMSMELKKLERANVISRKKQFTTIKNMDQIKALATVMD